MSTDAETSFIPHLLCVRIILDVGCKEVIGDLTVLDTKLKRRLGATSEVVQSFASEEQRLDSLRDFFALQFLRAEHCTY